jgi:capsule polysaccharide export protein KpsE/RkpR
MQASYSTHVGLSLTLFKLRVLFVDHIQFAFTAHNLAISRTLLNGRSDSHVECIISVCLIQNSRFSAGQVNYL